MRKLLSFGAVSALVAAVACSSASSSSESSSTDMCGSFAVQGSCTAHFVLDPSTQKNCPALPDGSLAINAGSSSYTTPTGASCTQTLSGCNLSRQCDDTSGTASQLALTFSSDGSYQGNATVSDTSGNNCRYDATGNCTTGSGSTDGGTSSSGGGNDGGSSSGGNDSGSCPAAQQCNGTCCDSGSVCVDNGTSKACAKSCTSSSECPSSAGCCTLLSDGSGACLADGLIQGQECRCTTGSECSSAACAPAVDNSGNPIGPYVCVPNDGAAYHGCHGALTSCGGSYCCVTDTKGNEFCALQCTNNSNCGAAHCDAYNFSSSTCSGPDACGP